MRSRGLGAVARCWEEKAREIHDMVVAVRDAVARGTDGQSGEFIDLLGDSDGTHRGSCR